MLREKLRKMTLGSLVTSLVTGSTTTPSAAGSSQQASESNENSEIATIVTENSCGDAEEAPTERLYEHIHQFNSQQMSAGEHSPNPSPNSPKNRFLMRAGVMGLVCCDPRWDEGFEM